MQARLWNRYHLARGVFDLEPSPSNEGAVVQTYAEFARSSCPEVADELISLLCRNLAEFVKQRSAA